MKATRILAIDGGGIRGIIPAKVLVTLEQLLQKHSGRSNARIAEYFDLIAGTSTGGILASIYLFPSAYRAKSPKYSAEDALDFYLKHGPEIFNKSLAHEILTLFGLVGSKYSDKSFVRLLNEYYGEIKLRELIKPCLITAYNVKQNCTTFFNQIDTLGREEKNFFVKDIIRATTAAPSYFPVAEISTLDGTMSYFLDGGVFANNPALCAYAEASKLSDQELRKRELLILSLGTGSKEITYNYQKMSKWGLLRWIEPVFAISRNGVSEVVDYQLRIMYQEANKSKDYLRIQVELKKDQKKVSQLDNVSPSNLKLLESIGEDLASEYYKELDEFARRLVEISDLEKIKNLCVARELIKKK